MALAAGTRLGAYEIVGLIGAGGMGEVYRARDSRLDRQVAIKSLPDALRTDPERAGRFAREAKLLATLNHPNIATIHGLEAVNGDQFIVMELVEGETLADRIARSPLPVEEAIPIAKQIAEALETAHEQGIIHRDLKPANIKVRSDSTVKVLDFGLAKALASDSPAGSALLSNSPTMTSPVVGMTGVGILLGTAPYMSPEQAKGRAADRRSDIWAFGCVLFEMLAGKRAFDGEDVTETLAAIVRGEPDWAALPPGLPPAILRVLRDCLQRDPHWRVQHIGDVRLGLSRANEPADVVKAAPPVRSRRSTRIMVGLLAIASIAIGAVAERFRGAPSPAAVIEFTIAPPPNVSLQTAPAAGSGVASQLAVSPDGKHLVFVANDQGGYRLWLRSLDRNEPRALSGTEGAAFPFWSPDSRSIAFFAAGKLKRMNLSGGPPTIVCDAADGRGGTWNQENVIVFTPAPRGVLQRVSATGATAVDASALDEAYGETNHRFASFLPDGRHFLFTAVVGTCCPAGKRAQIRIGALESKESVVLLQEESAATYSSGYIMFNRDGTLMAQAFDPSARRLAGEPFRLVDGIGSEGSRYASVSASTNGVLVYGKGQTMPRSRLTWFDRTGRELGTVGEVEAYPNIALSPDEHNIAVSILRGNPINSDLYRIDTKTGAAERLTFDPGADLTPIWSPDGQHLVFQGQRSGRSTLLQKAMVGTTSEDVLHEGGGGIMPTDWSADSRYLIYTYTPIGGNNDIWILPLFGDRKPIPYLETAAVETDGAFSPDGKWVAYSSSENGQPQVLVEPFPRTGGKVQISQNGGTKPIWRPDGRELFFLSTDLQLMSATIDMKSGLRRETPVALFPISTGISFSGGRQYAVSRDGQRFLVNMRQRQAAATLTVVVNWMAAVGK